MAVTPFCKHLTLSEAVPADRRFPYDVRAVIATLADAGTWIELRRDHARGIVTGLLRIEGRATGVLANDCRMLGGAVDSAAACKAAHFVQLCDAFGLPLLTLVDTPGFMVGPEIERQAQVRHACRMFVTAAKLAVPGFAVVVRKGYGLVAQAMALGGFDAPVFTVAWPTGEFGAMGLEGAVKLGFRKELAAIEEQIGEQPQPQEFIIVAAESADPLTLDKLQSLERVTLAVGALPAVRSALTPFTFLTFRRESLDGFGEGANNSGVVSFSVFNGSLYAGTRNCNNGGQIWRTSNGTTWNMVVGAGMDDPASCDVESLIVYGDYLYATPSTVEGATYSGAEVWRTADGTHWEPASLRGFGDSNNLRAGCWGDAAVIYNDSLYFGSHNWPNGGEIWQMQRSLYLPMVKR